MAWLGTLLRLAVEKGAIFMSRCFFFLILPLFLIVYNVHAESAPAKKDAFSELQNAFAPAKQEEETEKIKHLDEVSGLEWLQMSMGDRQDNLLASIYILNKNGVELRKSPNDYFNIVEEKLRSSPHLYDTDLTRILASIVYEIEPRSREALDKYKANANVKDRPSAEPAAVKNPKGTG